jgi:predicted transposase/invertase (TIGR01784 family)
MDNMGLSSYANPIVDVAFRHIMSNEEIAMSLINSVVPDFQDNPVNEITKAFDEVHLSPKKDAFMDFHAKTQRGDSVIIEMQAKRHVMFDERALCYAAHTYSHQLSDEILTRPDWYKELKPVYAIQFLDYDAQRIRGIRPREGEEDLDQLFFQEIQAHPMAQDAFMKYYVMVDRFSGQEVKRGIHLIQIELPRVTSIKTLSPRQDSFVERSEDFSLSDWWYCVLKHAEEFNVVEFEDEYGKRSGKFVHMPEPVYNAFRMLRRVDWGLELQGNYDREASEMGVYSTAMAVERAEGLLQGLLQGIIGEFIVSGQLSRQSRRLIRENPPDEESIREIWKKRMEATDVSSDSEAESAPPPERTVDDFIAYLRNKRGAISMRFRGG